jgi:hypothetical protein
VTRLSAAAFLPANLAIPSSALTPGSYHLTVSVSRLGQGCLIGRMGRVFFDNVPSKDQVLSLPRDEIAMGEMTGRRDIEPASESER